MCTPKISIIVPIYNAENTLYSCIKSILSQSFKDYELILVNDGSIDNSLQICNKLLESDSRIIIINQENKGVSSARNNGLDIARGEYITFIDADDSITEQFLQEFISNIGDSDCIIGGAVFETSSQKCSNKPLETNDNGYCRVKSNALINERNIIEFYIRVPWGKLYKREIINSYSLKFDNAITFGEDFLFNLSFLNHAHDICIIDKCNYIYKVQDRKSYNVTSYQFADFIKKLELLLDKLSLNNTNIITQERFIEYKALYNTIDNQGSKSKLKNLAIFIANNHFVFLPQINFLQRIKLFLKLVGLVFK